MTEPELINRVKFHEGYSGKPYRDTAGKLTIGYGRNLDDAGITEAEAIFMLTSDLRRAEKECISAFKWFGCLNKIRREVIIEMCFNLGLPKLKSFKKMLEAIKEGDYDTAAAEMLNSRWAKQVGRRAETLANLMKRGAD